MIGDLRGKEKLHGDNVTHGYRRFLISGNKGNLTFKWKERDIFPTVTSVTFRLNAGKEMLKDLRPNQTKS